MFGLGYQELLVILVIVLVLFRAKRLPELARSLGSSLKEFKHGINEAKAEDTTPATSKDDGGAGLPEGSCASLQLLQDFAGGGLEPLPTLRDGSGPGPGVVSPFRCPPVPLSAHPYR